MPNESLKTDSLITVEDGAPRDLTTPPTPREVIAFATTVADELASIIEKKGLASNIQGKKYVAVEGWLALAALRGCTPREVSNERDPDRPTVYVATVELVNADGRVIGRASAECGDPDEVDRQGKPVWADRPAYARRSMANTRATSKVCRQVFSWIMVLAGYAPTPAEEVPGEGFAQNASQARSEPRRGASQWDGNLVVKSGKYKGQKWSELPGGFLEWALGQDGAIKDMAAKETARRAKETEVIDGEVVGDDLPFGEPDPQDPRFL